MSENCLHQNYRASMSNCMNCFPRFVTILLSLSFLSLFAGCDKILKLPDLDALDKDNMVISETPQEDIVDTDYRFRLKSMGNQWKMMDQRKISGILPDAAAGAVHIKGVWGAVIVEPLEGMSITDYANLTQTNMENAGMIVTEPVPAELSGKPGLGYSANGMMDGLEFNYDVTTLLHQGFGYQVLTWGTSSQYQAHLAKEFRDNFVIEEGEVQTRSSSGIVADFNGVGHRVRDNLFESVISGMSATSTKDWSLMIGAELKQSHDSAEFGLKNTKLNMYFVVVPELISGMPKDAYAHHVSRVFSEVVAEQGKAEKSNRTIPVSIGGKIVEFTHYTVTEPVTMQWYFGVTFHDQKAYQFLSWSLSQNKEASLQALQNACQQVQYLTPNEIGKLDQQLRASPETEDDVGPDWCVRNGVYRDFTFGFTWEKPKGYWETKAGDEAVMENSDARISCHDAFNNISMQVIPEEGGGSSLGEYHKLVTRALFKRPVDLKRRNLDSVEALESEGVVLIDDLNLEYKLITTIRNNYAYQILIWGMEGSLEKLNDQMEDVIAGFRFPGPRLVPSFKSDTSYTDYRLGYSLNLPGNWTILENAPETIRAVGSGVEFRNARQEILVIAMNSVEPGQDASFIIDDLISTTLKANFSKFSNAKPVIKFHNFQGLEWKEHYWSGSIESVAFLTAVRGRTMYILTIVERFGKARKLIASVTEELRMLE